MATSARRRFPARPRPSRRSGRAHHISRGTRWVRQATERAPLSRGDHSQEEITPARRAWRKTDPCILGTCLSNMALDIAVSGRTVRSAESGAPGAAPGPRKLREAAADGLPGGGNRDSRTWPRPDSSGFQVNQTHLKWPPRKR